MEVFPAILTGDKKKAQTQLDTVMDSGLKVVQMDIIDGLFADNITISPADMAELNFGELSADIHIMTEEPMDYVHECIDVKAYIPIRVVIGQVERMSSQAHFIEEVKRYNWQVGLSLDLETPLEAIDEDSWQHLDVIQLMSIRAGFQGQEFERYVLEKIEELKQFVLEKGLAIHVFVDGGIKDEQLDVLAETGVVTGAAVGSAIWQAPNPLEAIVQLSGGVETTDEE